MTPYRHNAAPPPRPKLGWLGRVRLVLKAIALRLRPCPECCRVHTFEDLPAVYARTHCRQHCARAWPLLGCVKILDVDWSCPKASHWSHIGPVSTSSDIALGGSTKAEVVHALAAIAKQMAVCPSCKPDGTCTANVAGWRLKPMVPVPGEVRTPGEKPPGPLAPWDERGGCDDPTCPSNHRPPVVPPGPRPYLGRITPRMRALYEAAASPARDLPTPGPGKRVRR